MIIINDELKTIGDVAKVAEKTIDFASKFGSLIARLTEGSLKQGAGMFEDKLVYFRWERQVRLMKRADEFMKDNKITNPIPFKLAIPLLQGASLEEDDNLQDMWVKLLVNAVSSKGIEIKRIYMDILERLSPLEVKILDKIYGSQFNGDMYCVFATYSLPDSIHIICDFDTKYPELNNTDVELALINLARIGCLAPAVTISGGENFSNINITHLGRRFYEACTL